MDEWILVRVYRFLLGVYPAEFRAQFGEEMVEVFGEGLEEARRVGGWAVARHALRELASYPGNVARAYARSWRRLQPAVVEAPGLPWIAGWTALSLATLPLAWLLVPALGLLLATALRVLPGAGFAAAAGTLSVTGALGLATAGAQWLLLRRHVAGAGWWILLTTGGWLAVGVVIVAARGLAVRDMTQYGPGVVFMLIGFCVGLAQWLYLRRTVAGSGWWVPVSLLATGTVLLGGESFESIGESLAFLALPWLLTGAFLWLLLQRSPASGRSPAGELSPADGRSPAIEPSLMEEQPAAALAGQERRRRRNWPVYAALGLLLALAGPWAYAAGHLALAKAAGIYASPEAAVRARAEAVEGVQVEDVSVMMYDGGLPHVQFVGSHVRYDRPNPATGRQRESGGGYFIQVEGGWVTMGEGAFPEVIGWLMGVYGLEGVGIGD